MILKTICCPRTVGCQRFVQYIRKYVLKGFILVVSTVPNTLVSPNRFILAPPSSISTGSYTLTMRIYVSVALLLLQRDRGGAHFAIPYLH